MLKFWLWNWIKLIGLKLYHGIMIIYIHSQYGHNKYTWMLWNVVLDIGNGYGNDMIID